MVKRYPLFKKTYVFLPTDFLTVLAAYKVVAPKKLQSIAPKTIVPTPLLSTLTDYSTTNLNYIPKLDLSAVAKGNILGTSRSTLLLHVTKDDTTSKVGENTSIVPVLSSSTSSLSLGNLKVKSSVRQCASNLQAITSTPPLFYCYKNNRTIEQ